MKDELCFNYFNHFFFDLIKNDKSIYMENKNAYCWIAGGALRSYFSKGYVDSDIDVFFVYKLQFEIVRDILIKNNDVKTGYSDENISNFYYKGKKIQLISRFYYNNMQDCINSFDFTVTCCAIDIDGKIIHHPRFFQDLAMRKLVINKLPFPIATLERLQKYIKKGYSICNGGLLEIVNAIRNLNDKDMKSNHLEFYPDGTPRFKRID